MPTVNLPGSLCLSGKNTIFTVTSTTLQKIIVELFHNSNGELARFKAFIQADKDGNYFYNALIACVSNEIITDLNYEFRLEDQITFFPLVSGG